MQKISIHNIELDKIIARAAEGCVCAEGRAQLLDETPAETAEEERFLLRQTAEITALLARSGSPRFGGVSGVREIVAHASKGGQLSMGDLLHVAGALRNFEGLAQWGKSEETEGGAAADLFYTLTPQPALEREITASILSADEMADTASHTLQDLRRSIRRQENSIRDKLDALVKSQASAKFLQDAVVSMRNGRYVVPVKSEYRGEVGGIIHDVSATGATVFVEPTAVVETNARILQLRAQEQAEIARILSALSQQVGGIRPQFDQSYASMLSLDVLLAKAKLALLQNASLPQVTAEARFRLVRARHPLLDPAACVPIDLELGKEYDTVVVTGPNTGGKTVTLKTAGLLSAMAQFGYLIPAGAESTVCPFRDILVDIGDEQSIEQSLSTFSGHMKNISSILQTAGRDTLVLIDELGAGTDPAEGAALAVAILQQLRRQGALILATTHYAELKVYALETPGVVNASCEFDVETLRPTYRISVGVPGKSNAFLISSRLGIPQELIEAARAQMSSDDKRLDVVLSQLDELKEELKAARAEADAARHAAANALQSAEEKRDALVRQGERELEAARERAQALVNTVQQEAFTLTDELRRLQKDEKNAASQRLVRARQIARQDTEKLLSRAEGGPRKEGSFTPLESVQLGQEVELAAMGTLGIVQALPDKKGMVEVRCGILTTKVPLSGLKAPDKRAAAPKARTRAQRAAVSAANRPRQVQRTEASRQSGMECDLRGMMVEEALLEVDQFIDHALLNNVSTVTLIHGKGTGALRAGIQQHLRTHKNVAGYRLGGLGEGDTGVTIVQLK